MYKFNPYSIPTFFVGIFLVFLGSLVFSRNRKSEINFSFLLVCASSAVWELGYSLIYISQDEATANFWQKFVYMGVPFIAPAMYHLSVAYFNLRRQKILVVLFYLIGFFFVCLSFTTNLLVKGVHQYFWGYYKQAGAWYTFFLLIWLIPGILALYNFYNGRKNTTSPVENERRRYIVTAFTIVFIGFWDFIPAYGIGIYPFGYIGVVACLSIIAYAILRYRLMDVTLVITRTGIFIVVYAFVLGSPFILATLGRDYLIALLGVHWWLGPLVLMAVLGIAGPFIYISLKRSAEAILFREQRRYQLALQDAAEEMTRLLSLRKLLDFITHVFTKAVRITHAAVYLYEEASDTFSLKSARNTKKSQPSFLPSQSALLKWLKDEKNPLVFEEVNRRAQEDSFFHEISNGMQDFNATVVVPLLLQEKLTGIIVLGDKRSGRIYTSEDLNAFLVMATQSALAIENASLYSNIEEQVSQRTRELNEVQKQLIQAEKLASVGTLAGGVAHEINNPLTAILTNVQMLLVDEEALGADSRESLVLIEEATKRCRTIVQKLMSYARKPLESAQVSLFDLQEAVRDAVAFLKYQFEQENIRIIINASADAFRAKGNQNEMEQVITNILLNAKDAIKRLKKDGSITISLMRNDSRVRILIKDDGVGIPKEILSKIFDPFFTTKDVGKGLGLGLSICQAIVEKYGGMIKVQSQPQKGTVFTIEFPAVEGG